MAKSLFLTLCKSLVRSHLDYGILIFYPTTKKYKQILENAQRRATRLVPLLHGLDLFDTGSCKFRDFYQNRNGQQDGFALTSVGEDFVYKELCKLNSSKGTGSDNIPPRHVKDATSVLIKPVTHIVNLSIQTGIVPCELKNTRVVPVFKKNKRSDVSNYRPISVLSVVSKILKKAVYVQLEGHLVNNNLFYEFQSGFWSKTISNDQELIQSDPISCPQNQKGK